MTQAWLSTDGIPHFGVWHTDTQCPCSSNHKLYKQFDSVLDPEITLALKSGRMKTMEPEEIPADLEVHSNDSIETTEAIS